jgi:hypothetical protein
VKANKAGNKLDLFKIALIGRIEFQGALDAPNVCEPLDAARSVAH